MKRWFMMLSALMCVVTLAVAQSASPVPTDDDDEPSPRSYRQVLDEATAAMSEQRFDDAALLYGELGERFPNPIHTYNRGLAEYKAGRIDDAVASMADAMEKSGSTELLERGAFNLGRMATERAAQPGAMEGLDPELGSNIDLADGYLERLLDQYRWRIKDEPADDQLRARGELAHDLRNTLQQLREMMPTQPSANDDASQNPEDASSSDDQQQGEDQSQSSQSQDPSQNQDQSQSSSSDDQPQNDEQQSSDSTEQPESQQGEQDQSNSQQDQQESGEQSQEQQQSGSGGQTQERPSMSEDDAERLLQLIREREEQRRQQLLARSKTKPQPVDKDW
ncbi:MAG: hypothetical protein AAF432_10650 [Planctomycetota bacterium]